MGVCGEDVSDVRILISYLTLAFGMKTSYTKAKHIRHVYTRVQTAYNFLNSFFLDSSFLGNRLLPSSPLGILWEFLSWFAWQLLLNPQILLFQDARYKQKRNWKNVPCWLLTLFTELRPEFVNNCVMCQLKEATKELSLVRWNTANGKLTLLANCYSTVLLVNSSPVFTLYSMYKIQTSETMTNLSQMTIIPKITFQYLLLWIYWDQTEVYWKNFVSKEVSIRISYQSVLQRLCQKLVWRPNLQRLESTSY